MKISFETATLADSLRKANLATPTRGGSSALTAGIIFKIKPDTDNLCTVMSTDGEIFYRESVAPLGVKGEEVTWRLPGLALTSIVTNLPMGNNKTVSIDDELEPGRVVITSGRVKVRLATLSVLDYPMWEPFQEGEQVVTIPNLSGAIQRLKWASSEQSGTLRSVFITKEAIYSTDRSKVARLAVLTGLTEPIILPNEQIVKVIPKNTDVKISQSGKIFVTEPDEYTQVATVTFEEKPLPVWKILDADYKYHTTFSKSEFLAMLNRALAFDSSDRQNTVNIKLGSGKLVLLTDDKEVGMFGEVIDAEGSAESSEKMNMSVGPDALRDAISSLHSEVVNMYYNDSDARPGVITFRDGIYSCSIALRRPDIAGPKSES